MPLFLKEFSKYQQKVNCTSGVQYLTSKPELNGPYIHCGQQCNCNDSLSKQYCNCFCIILFYKGFNFVAYKKKGMEGQDFEKRLGVLQDYKEWFRWQGDIAFLSGNIENETVDGFVESEIDENIETLLGCDAIFAM